MWSKEDGRSKRVVSFFELTSGVGICELIWSWDGVVDVELKKKEN